MKAKTLSTILELKKEKDNGITPVIRVSLNRQITIRQYLNGLIKAKMHLNDDFPTTLCNWWGGTGQDIVNEYRQAIHDRINQRGQYDKI